MRQLAWLPVLLGAVVSGCACGPTVGADCQSSTDCGGSLVCLDTKTCAKACASDAECAADQRCSASGGCVTKTGCGSNADCSSTQACTAAGVCAQSCQGAGSCGSTAVCLASGTCAPKCTDASSCAAGEKCSTVGACVPGNGCGAQADCASGQLCDSLGRCVPDCRTTGCNAGATCSSSGECVPAAADGGAMTCGGELFQAQKVSSNMLIAFDKSGSMADAINGTPKWNIATTAIKQVTAQYQSQIRFGLVLFPLGGQSSQSCVPASISVPVGDMKASAIAQVLDNEGPAGRTPIGGVLTAAGNAPDLADPMRANYVLLMTDGTETCSGDGVAAATANLQNKGIKTFVVGFGGEVDATNLSDIAVAGGTPRAGTPRYYQADDAPGLLQAFNVIAQGALGCEYRLAQAPPDPAKIFVYVNGVLQNRDVSHANGWDYSAATQRITFYGGLCRLVATDANAKVSIVYGCRDDSLIETDKRDGGAGLPNGSACVTNLDCSNRLCAANICGKAEGQPCTSELECASTVCVNNVCAPGIN